jgi:hypothetical protein
VRRVDGHGVGPDMVTRAGDNAQWKALECQFGYHAMQQRGPATKIYFFASETDFALRAKEEPLEKLS